MAYLILDLDETVFVATDIIQKGVNLARPIESVIHYEHILSEKSIEVQNPSAFCKIKIINSAKLSDLINEACEEHDGLIILTSGLWSPSVRDVLADYLDLSQKADVMLRSCGFYNALTDRKWFDGDHKKAQAADKHERLRYIVNENPIKYQGKRFVALDDNPMHIEALAKCIYVEEAVMATTATSDTFFYDDAKAALKRAQREELQVLPVKKRRRDATFQPTHFQPQKRAKLEVEVLKENSLESLLSMNLSQ